MDDLVRSRGMGLILISHNLHLVSSFCDRVLVMYAGRVVETCIASELAEARHPYTRGLLASLPELGRRRAELPQLLRDPAWAEDARVIELEHVTVGYGKGAGGSIAASDVSFVSTEGEAFGLVGESGSGKSTVLRAIAGLIPHAQGHVVAGRTGDVPGAAARRRARWCRWCSRTRTVRCIRTRRSTRR